MARRAENQYLTVRLTASLHRAGGPQPRSCLDWRLEAKNPGDQWDLRSTVGFGSVKVAEAYPASRDDVLALMIELLMSMTWTADGVTLDY